MTHPEHTASEPTLADMKQQLLKFFPDAVVNVYGNGTAAIQGDGWRIADGCERSRLHSLVVDEVMTDRATIADIYRDHFDDDGALTVPDVPAPMPPEEPVQIAPGIVRGLSAPEYHADPSLGSSTLRLFRHTTAEGLHKAAKGVEPNEDMDVGTVVHSLSEGDRESFVVLDEQRAREEGAIITYRDMQAALRKVDGVSSGGDTDTLAQRIREHLPDACLWIDEADKIRAQGRTPVNEFAYRRAMSTWEGIKRNPRATAILNACQGNREVSAFWEDPLGVDGKLRADGLTASNDIVDIKTTTDPRALRPDRLWTLVRDRGWDVQLQWYTRGLEYCGITPNRWFIILATTVKPFVCEVIQLSRETWGPDAMATVERCAIAYRDRDDRSMWKGWSSPDAKGRPTIQTIHKPEYAQGKTA